MLPLIPDSFLGGSAPCPESFSLSSIPFPGSPNLLFTATHLVHLGLTSVTDSEYIATVLASGRPARSYTCANRAVAGDSGSELLSGVQLLYLVPTPASQLYCTCIVTQSIFSPKTVWTGTATLPCEYTVNEGPQKKHPRGAQYSRAIGGVVTGFVPADRSVQSPGTKPEYYGTALVKALAAVTRNPSLAKRLLGTAMPDQRQCGAVVGEA